MKSELMRDSLNYKVVDAAGYTRYISNKWKATEAFVIQHLTDFPHDTLYVYRETVIAMRFTAE